MNNKSAYIIAASIIIGFVILSISLFMSINGIGEANKRYQFISPNESNIIIFDTKTGEYWNKYISPSEGPADWTKDKLDFLENK